MSKKHLASYKKLASSRGYPEPMQYLFSRLKSKIASKDHEGATKIALELIPYGHGKVAQVDPDTGEVAQQIVFKLD